MATDRLADIAEESTEERNRPAIVNGSERQGVALFIADADGNLVDIEYLCSADAWNAPGAEGALWWPAFDFGDSGAYCRECSVMIDCPSENQEQPR